MLNPSFDWGGKFLNRQVFSTEYIPSGKFDHVSSYNNDYKGKPGTKTLPFKLKQENIDM